MDRIITIQMQCVVLSFAYGFWPADLGVPADPTPPSPAMSSPAIEKHDLAQEATVYDAGDPAGTPEARKWLCIEGYMINTETGDIGEPCPY